MPATLSALRPVCAAPLPCKICGNPAELFDVVDFHKSCEEPRGLRLPLSGVPVYYRRCRSCGFLFTDAFDDWSQADFKAHIYNDGYQAIDPDYRTERPGINARVVTELWAGHVANTSVLDFGGGNDVLCTALRANGFPRAATYDPMVPEHARRPEGKFDLVTCFETMEHLPDPVAGLASIITFVAEPGLIFYSTLLQPSDLDKHGAAWWYVSPRNGHVSIFTKEALALAWGRHGYKTVSFSPILHLAFRTLPSYLAHLQSRVDGLPTPNDSIATAPAMNAA